MTLECPYCGHENEDPEIESLEEEESDHTTCDKCKKNFSYFFTVHYHFEGQTIEEEKASYARIIKTGEERIERLKKQPNDGQNEFNIKCSMDSLSSNKREFRETEELIEENLTIKEEND